MDPDRRVLLVHFSFDWDRDLPQGLWACPGGGIDPGETTAQALVRELQEELGLAIVDPGPPIWWKEHLFPMERWDGQRDTYFWVEVEAFEPRPQFSAEELAAENLDSMRWWSYDEVRAAQAAYDRGDTDDPSYAVLSPRRLGHLLDDLLAHGRPDDPLHIDPR
jgi:8-oxo-dGTP pyrophosphatase MutT (NUDIX family)